MNVFVDTRKRAISSGCFRLGVLILSAWLISSSFTETKLANAFFAHGSSLNSSQQTTLTPLQREIEKERERLTSAEKEVKRDALMRLAAIARPESSCVASVALTDSSPIIRATAVKAVLSLPPDQIAELLIPLLQDRDEFVRRETAYALGLARVRAAVGALITVLEGDKSAAVRGAAAVALGQIGDAAAVPALSETITRRVSRSGIFNRITRRKTEENEFVRRSAAHSLGELKSREAVPVLIAVLSNERNDNDLRREAAEALGLIGDREAIPALRAALNAHDPYLARIAYEALRKIDVSSSPKQT